MKCGFFATILGTIGCILLALGIYLEKMENKEAFKICLIKEK